MYFTTLPDHTAHAFNEREHFARFSHHNVIFNAFSRQIECENHVGCLSLKTISTGEEWYHVDGRPIAVRPGQFLILNDNQTYSSRIDAAAKVFSIFFQKDFAASVFDDGMQSEKTLLDNANNPRYPTPEFFQTLHFITPDLAARLRTLHSQLETYGDDKNRIDEQLVFLLRHLIHTHRTEARQLTRVSALRPATKKEIFRRLCIAKDFLHSSFRDPIDLTQLSAKACLSKPQLIRQFKTVFSKTPYQYLVTLRLRHAAESLRSTSMAVNEIAWHSGFQDPSAFCRAFRAAYDTSPEQYRHVPSGYHALNALFP